jgi:hypothetical protein
MGMRTAKSLGLLLFVAASNAALVYGCSSDSTSDNPGEGEEAGTVDKDAGTDGSIIPDVNVPDAKDAGKDAKKDTGKDTSAPDTDIVDSGPDVVYDPPGSPCSSLSQIQERGCAMCGTQNRVCLKQLDGGADATGQPGYWSDWSDCVSPATAVCDPLQTYGDEACGNCGTRQRICQLDCTFVQGLTCQNEGACSPGSADWQQGLGCSTPDGGSPLGRLKTCNSTCQYDIAQTCTTAPPNPNNISITATTAGTVYSKVFLMGKTPTESRVVTSFSASLGDCPTTLSSTVTVRSYIEVKNTTASALHVSVWHSSAATTPKLDDDTIMTLYPGGIIPKTDTDRQNCLDHTNDVCESTIGNTLTPKACVNNAAGILKGDTDTNGDPYPGVLIPAHGSVTVYLAPYNSSSQGGNFTLNVKVEGP